MSKFNHQSTGLVRIFFFALPIFLSPLLALAADTQMFFGGFAFAGNSGDVKINFPRSSTVGTSDQDSLSFFDRATREFFQKNKERFSGISLEFDQLAKKEESQLVLALALTNENILLEKFSDFHKLVIQLGFELLVLDFQNLQVVSSQPVYLELVDTSKTPFDESDLRHRIKKMTSGDDSQLFSALVNKISQIKPSSKNQCTLQISRVSVGEKALSFVPQPLRMATNAYAQTTAQQFGSLLSAKAGVALLPYAKDRLNTQMALRFSDTSVVNFKIPKPTFAIDLDVEGFKKVLHEQTAAEALWIYGAFLKVRLYEPEFNKMIFDAPVKFGVSKIVPISQKSIVDEYPIVSDALKGAFISAIVQMQKDKETAEKVLKRCLL